MIHAPASKRLERVDLRAAKTQINIIYKLNFDSLRKKLEKSVQALIF